jgi:hypothetical protein
MKQPDVQAAPLQTSAAPQLAPLAAVVHAVVLVSG